MFHLSGQKGILVCHGKRDVCMLGQMVLFMCHGTREILSVKAKQYLYLSAQNGLYLS